MSQVAPASAIANGSIVSEAPADGHRRILPTIFAILLGTAISLVFRGYQFGGSNHTVYLLDALRRQSPELLANDWYTTQTLQYHAIFGELTAILLRWGMVEPAFLIGYLALAVLLQVAWRWLVQLLLAPSPLGSGKGANAVYLASVVLYYLLAGGTGLGMYQFLQDACFLPSNISNVAMLWAIACWIANRRGWAGAWLGVAGLFHLNHAVVGIGLWAVLSAWSWWDRRRVMDRSHVIGTLLGVGLPLVNILLAMRVLATRTGTLPLEQFVELYVRLRHPHHYDPSTWPIALWLSILVPIPLALAAWARRSHEETWVRRIFLVFLGLQLVALIGAGLWYLNESLIQMSLWRFSIYVKLLSCIGAVQFFVQARWFRRGHATAAAAIALTGIVGIGLAALAAPEDSVLRRHQMMLAVLLVLVAMVALYPLLQRSWRPLAGSAFVVALLAMAWGRWLGVQVIPGDDADYLQMCRWAGTNTPVDAVFLVPPDEQVFRLHARRAIVVNFKGVPQLSGEIPGWRDRLDDVLHTDVRTMAGSSFPRTLRAMHQRYNELSEQALLATAEKYGVTHLLATRPLPSTPRLTPVHHVNGRYFMYHLTGKE